MGLSKNQAETSPGPEGAAVPIAAAILPENENDGYIAVTFSDGDIEVRADFFPPLGKGALISDEYIADLIEKLNIVHGVKWGAIREAAAACNLNRRVVRNVIIARGDAPVNEVGEYFERNPHLAVSNAPPNDQSQSRRRRNARIDYREYSPFIIVKQNQVLAKFRPRKTGQDGKDIHGKVIPYRVFKPEGIEPGQNTRIDGQFLVAVISGQLVENNKVMNVQDSLVIKGAVGYATGNISFPGNVVINGPVCDGFKIYSGGSVNIKQTFDVTDVVTKDDLTVAGGIIGRGRAFVKVGGNLKARFIDNCQVACRKSIIVDKEIINSRVFTMDTLEMSDKSTILGSDIYAIHGLRVGNLGKKSGKASQIHCGVDFTLQHEKEKSNNQLRMLTAKLGKLKELMALQKENENFEQHVKMAELLRRLEDEKEKISKHISDIMGESRNDEHAAVEIRGEIIPGTLIEICQIALFVTEPIKKVRISLNKIQRKLIFENL
ncbi:MAG: FapA family protein [Treponema sp.]|jgi:uncharacterized protein (DUF342 family)|nr:FapA family protein [Treponema sp.]